MNKEDLRNSLIVLSDEQYRNFHLRLQPSRSEVIGVRMGELRKIAKRLAKEDWQKYMEALEGTDSYEEKTIAGMSIFYSKSGIDEKMEYCSKILHFIDGWAVCDSICSTIKLTKEEVPTFWDYTVKCVSSSEEFEARFGFVAMLDLFIDSTHIDEIIGQIDHKSFAGYYDSMAAARLIWFCWTSIFPTAAGLSCCAK